MSIAPAGTPESRSSRPATARQKEPQKLKPLDRLRDALRARHYSPRTEHTYCHWATRFIFDHLEGWSASMRAIWRMGVVESISWEPSSGLTQGQRGGGTGTAQQG